MDLMSINADMEVVMKAVEKFMNEKRSQFPRFYFLSKDEMFLL